MTKIRPMLQDVNWDDKCSLYRGHFELESSDGKVIGFCETTSTGFDVNQELEDFTVEFFNNKYEQYVAPYDSEMFEDLELQTSLGITDIITEEIQKNYSIC